MPATLGVLLVVAASVFAQEPQIQPSPALPANVLGPQLIVWSELQKPRPVPQPLPPPDRPEQVPDQQQPQPGQPANAQDQQQPAAQTFTGTIVKDGTKYILKESSGTTYQLDDQDNAKQYEGKQVKVLGNLDANSHTLHVVSIEVIS